MTRSARLFAVAAPLALASALLGGCKEEAPPPPPEVQPSAAAAAQAGPVVESEYGTPVKDRVATLGLLNKRNNITQDVVLKSGEAKRIGNVVIRLATCERTLPWERPAETGAFVQVFVEERADSESQLAWRKVFSGWLFKNAPSVNVVEHPVYDVWVKDCAMKFPGEEDSPAAAASPSSAAKAEGSASPSPSPSPSAAPSATPSPAAKPPAAKAPAPTVDL